MHQFKMVLKLFAHACLLHIVACLFFCLQSASKLVPLGTTMVAAGPVVICDGCPMIPVRSPCGAIDGRQIARVTDSKASEAMVATPCGNLDQGSSVDVEAKNIVLPAGVPSRSHGEKDSCGTKKA